MGREHEIKVRVNGDELAVLDEMRNGVSRAAYLRSLIRKPPGAGDVADRREALGILSSLARDGRVAAAVALERALRGEDVGPDADLDRLLRGDE
jgi:hypothetical protein